MSDFILSDSFFQSKSLDKATNSPNVLYLERPYAIYNLPRYIFDLIRNRKAVNALDNSQPAKIEKPQPFEIVAKSLAGAEGRI